MSYRGTAGKDSDRLRRLGNQGSNLDSPDSESGVLPVTPFPIDYSGNFGAA
jgi:hypothetical protein